MKIFIATIEDSNGNWKTKEIAAEDINKARVIAESNVDSCVGEKVIFITEK